MAVTGLKRRPHKRLDELHQQIYRMRFLDCFLPSHRTVWKNCGYRRERERRLREVAMVVICVDHSAAGSGTRSRTIQIVSVRKSHKLLWWEVGETILEPYLDFFLSQRNATHDVDTSRLVWFWVPFIFRLEYSMVFWAKKCGESVWKLEYNGFGVAGLRTRALEA